MNCRPSLLIFAFIGVLACRPVTAAEPVNVVVVGDSTVSEYPPERPDRGWGHYLEERFRPGTVAVTNLAVPGRSTKTFIAEGRWQKALQLNPTYVFIQFGHNDSHAAKNPEATDAATSYKANLKRYIDDARAIGATPILVTPMVRRTFDSDGQFTEAPSPGNRPLGDYARAMKEVGVENGVPVIDLYASSKALVEKLGAAASAELANRPGDNTHFNEKGARAMADLVIAQLPAAAPDLARRLKPATPPAETKDGGSAESEVRPSGKIPGKAATEPEKISPPQPEAPMPKLVERNGHHALLVDGQPFFVLGGQSHNSSAWPALLPQVWDAIEGMHANTLEIPIYWQQIEPQEGTFDFSLLDTIVTQAREHNVRVVLLWFATWKNGNTDYTPDWVKLQPLKYPHMLDRNGRTVMSPSPHAETTLAADAKAFAATMSHLKSFDPQHTVIMVQVENEPGTYGTPRDFSPAAEELFQAPVPAPLLRPEVLKALNKPADAKGTWSQVFGDDADEFFHAWSVAGYINRVAEAGQAVNPLPMYVNVALEGEPGGAMPNVIPIYKAAAPAIGVLAPDIYQQPDKGMKTIERYDRPDNPLFVPETFGSVDYLFEVIRRGGIGFSPFGVDRGLPNAEPGPNPRVSPLAATYAMLRLADRELGKWIFEQRVHVATVTEQAPNQDVSLGRWKATVSFGARRRGGPPEPATPATTAAPQRGPDGGAGATPKPGGRALIAQLGENEIVVMATQCRVALSGANPDQPWQFLKVEEGYFKDGSFHLIRLRNGDEVGWSTVTVGADPVLLRITLTSW